MRRFARQLPLSRSTPSLGYQVTVSHAPPWSSIMLKNTGLVSVQYGLGSAPAVIAEPSSMLSITLIAISSISGLRKRLNAFIWYLLSFCLLGHLHCRIHTC